MADREPASRREFLSLASVGAAGAAAATVVADAPQAQAAQAEAGDGYRETAHVKAYLDSCRF